MNLNPNLRKRLENLEWAQFVRLLDYLGMDRSQFNESEAPAARVVRFDGQMMLFGLTNAHITNALARVLNGGGGDDGRQTQERSHQSAPMRLHITIVVTFGFLALACIGGGIYAIAANANSQTEFVFLGVHFTTDHVGVAFVGMGLIVAFFTIRAVLKNLRDLAAVPPGKRKPNRRTR